jgi:hypothetical protein
LEDNNMAYKFQLGAARLSGSIIQTDGNGDLRATVVDSLSSGIVDASGLASLDGGINVNDDFTVDVDGNVVAVAGTYSGLASLDGGINVNDDFTVDVNGAVVAVGVNAGGAVTGVTTLAASGLMSVASISMDDGSTIGPDSVADLITLSADGDFTFKDGAYDLNIASHDGTNGLALAGTIVTSDAAELNLLDGSGVGNVVNSKAVIYSAAGQVNSTTLSASSNVSSGGSFFGAGIALADASGIAGTGIDNNAGELQVATAQTLIESITNNSLLLEGNGTIKLDLTNSGIAKFKLGNDDKLIVNTSGVTIPGNLTVQGTTTTIDSTTINVSRSFTFEGTASDFETTFGYGATGAPIQDITVVLPEYSSSAGAHSVKAAVIAAGDSAANYAAAALVTAAEFAVLDGNDSATSVTIVDSDQMILNDEGTMIQIAMSDVKTYAGGAAQVLQVAVVADGATLVADKLQYVADRDGAGQSVGLTLPASAAGLIGKSIYIKAGNLENSAVITVATAAAGQKIDGADSIILESPYASVRLIYVTTDQWRVF